MMKYPNVTAGQTEACINRLGGWDNFLRFIGGQGKVVFDSALTHIRTVWVSAQPAVTTSEEYFKDAEVRVMGDNFKKLFLGLTTSDTKEVSLVSWKIKHDLIDAPVITELGNKAEISVGQFCAFLRASRCSKEFFIFHICGNDGKLWAVFARWSGTHRGWGVEARSVVNVSLSNFAAYQAVSLS